MERMTWAGLRTAGVAQGSGQAKCRLLPPAFNMPLSLTLPRVLLPAPGPGGSPGQNRKALAVAAPAQAPQARRMPVKGALAWQEGQVRGGRNGAR